MKTHQRRRTEGFLVASAVAEALPVLILTGGAVVEEREFGDPWTG